jgi:hypothetical protein
MALVGKAVVFFVLVTTAVTAIFVRVGMERRRRDSLTLDPDISDTPADSQLAARNPRTVFENRVQSRSVGWRGLAEGFERHMVTEGSSDGRGSRVHSWKYQLHRDSSP